MTKRCGPVAHILISAAERQRAAAPQHLLPPVGRPSAPGEAHEAGTAAFKSLLLLAFHHGGQGHWCRAVRLQLGDKRHCVDKRLPVPQGSDRASLSFTEVSREFANFYQL